MHTEVFMAVNRKLQLTENLESGVKHGNLRVWGEKANDV
jgi:hypothetical protein